MPYMTMHVWVLFCAKFKTDVCSYSFLMEILFSLVDFHLLLWGSCHLLTFVFIIFIAASPTGNAYFYPNCYF